MISSTEMSKEKKVSSILTGVSGEYFAAAELSRRGHIASITLRNTKGIDIVASKEDGSKTINIQVKTSSKNTKGWMLNKKAESMSDKNMFYIFVRLNEINERPQFHIVPTSYVAKKVKKEHQEWLDSPGRGGIKRKDSDVRKFEDPNNDFLDRWELLGLD